MAPEVIMEATISAPGVNWWGGACRRKVASTSNSHDSRPWREKAESSCGAISFSMRLIRPTIAIADTSISGRSRDQFLPADRPMLAAMVRALPIGVVFMIRSRRLPSGDWWWRAGVLGVLNIGAFFALLFEAAFRLPGGVAATAGALQPLIASGLAAVIIGERFTRRSALAGFIGMIGVALLVLRARAALDPLGVAAALAATVSMATGIVLTKRWKRPVDLITFTGWQLTAGGLVLMPIVLLTEGLPARLTNTNVAGFAWLAIVGTGLAYANWFKGIEALPVSTASFLGLLSPLVATAAGWIVLHQSLTFVQLVGALLVLVAVAMSQVARRRPLPGDAI